MLQLAVHGQFVCSAVKTNCSETLVSPRRLRWTGNAGRPAASRPAAARTLRAAAPHQNQHTSPRTMKVTHTLPHTLTLKNKTNFKLRYITLMFSPVMCPGFSNQCVRCNKEVKDIALMEASISSIQKTQQDIQRWKRHAHTHICTHTHVCGEDLIAYCLHMDFWYVNCNQLLTGEKKRVEPSCVRV